MWRCPHFRGVGIEGSTVYRGVLISGGWNRGFQMSSFQGVGVEGSKCPHFRGLE